MATTPSTRPTVQIFAEVPTRPDFPALERETMERWEAESIVTQYLHKNDNSETKYSFLDGPITANNPMGVHHAWGRTYKDLFQRYHAMLGKKQRFQNGFDCQGLWVEVEVEKELGLKSKRDIESFGIAEFVERCKERVLTSPTARPSSRTGSATGWTGTTRTSRCPTRTTTRSGTSSRRAMSAAGSTRGTTSCPGAPAAAPASPSRRSSPRATRTGHTSRSSSDFPLVDEPNASLLVWTTTPWTLAANVAAAVHPDLTYVQVEQDGRTYYLAQGAAQERPPRRVHDDPRVEGHRPASADRIAGRSTSCQRPRGSVTASSPGTTSAPTKAPASSTSRPAAVRKTSRFPRSTTWP